VSPYNLKMGALRLSLYKTSHPKIQAKLSDLKSPKIKTELKEMGPEYVYWI